MTSDSSRYKTRPSLLLRLRDRNAHPTAWDEFMTTYAPMIYSWCRKWGVKDADARDVTQTVILRLLVVLKSFQHKEGLRFRSYLSTIARHLINDLRAVPTADRSARITASEPAREDLTARLERLYDLELAQIARRQVERQVTPQTWEIFSRLVDLCESPASVATSMSVTITTVYKAKANVIRLLKQHIEDLEERSSL